MIKYLCPVLIICFVSVAAFNKSYGQTTTDATNTLQTAINNTNIIFNKAIGEESSLYNGPEYYFYNPIKFKGSAYFKDTITTFGSVCYDGAQHSGIPLFYDLYKDALVTALPNNRGYFSLLKEEVQSFDLLGHHFININADTLSNNSVIKSGYYDELYHGRSQVLVKIAKVVGQIQITNGTTEGFTNFSAATQDFYIRKNNVYYGINREGQLLDVLKDKKKQVKDYIKANNIKFKKDPEKASATIAAYYDSLSK